MDSHELKILIQAEDKTKAGTEAAKENLKGVSAAATAGGASVSVLTSAMLRAAATSAAAVITFDKVVQGVKAIALAAMQAEAASVKLQAALDVAGFGEQAESVQAWAQAMLRAKGVNDELSASLVADAVAKGVSVRQAQELVSASADLAVVTGSLVGTFDELVRASDGDQRAMQTLARQFNIVYREGMPFKDLLEELKKKTEGLAEANLDTAAGQWRLFFENVGNEAERLGGRLNRLSKSIAAYLNEALQGARERGGPAIGMESQALEFERAALQMEQRRGKIRFGSRSYMEREQRIIEISREIARLRADANAPETRTPFKLGAESQAGAFVDASAWLAEQKRRRDEANQAAETASKSAADAEETRYRNAQQAIEDNTKSLQDYFFTLQRIEELNRKAEPPSFAEMVQGGQVTSRETILQRRLEQEAKIQKADIQKIIADYTSKLKEVTSAEEDKMRAQKEYTDADKVATANAVLSAKASKEKVRADMEAAQSAYMFAQALVSVAQSLQSGNIGGAISGIGSMAMMGGGMMMMSPTAGPAAPIVFGVGAGLSLAGAFIPGPAPPTPGEEAQDKLYGLLRGIGLESSPRTRMSGAEFSQLAQGAQDLYKAWAGFITGEGGELTEQARILAGSLEDLDLTTGQTSDAMALMKANADGMSFEAARMQASWAALVSTAELTDEAFADLVKTYRDGYTWEKQYAEALQKFKKDLEGGASLDVLKADRQNIVALLQKREEDKRKTEQLIAEAAKANGMSEEDAKKLVLASQSDSDKFSRMVTALEKMAGTEAHGGYVPHPGASGERWTRVLNSEYILKPEQLRLAMEFGGQRQGEGATPIIVTVVSQLDGRELARSTHRHTRDLQRSREVR